MSRALLDINLLLALFDSDHVDHGRVSDWLPEGVAGGWASCAITENGFVRIISQERYPSPVSPSEAIRRLAHATDTKHHQFWPCEISLLDHAVVDPSRLHGPRQVTDAYLLALAVCNGGRFVTFDRNVPLTAVRSARTEHLEVL